MKKLVLLSTAAAALFMAGCAPKAPEVDMNADANKVEQPATTPATISDAERLNLLQSQVQNVYFDFDKFNIAHEDTLISPQHWDEEPFEVIVSNPPLSII